MSPDGRYLYVGSTVNGIMIIDTAQDRILPAIIATGGPVFELAVTPDGRKIFAALGQQGVKSVMLSNGEVRQVTRQICPEAVSLDPSGRTLYVSYQCGGPLGRPGHDSLEIFDAVTERSIGLVSGPPMVGPRAIISPDMRPVVLNCLDACSTPAYDHQGCPGVPTNVVHFVSADTRQVFKSLGMSAYQGPVEFTDSNHLLFLKDSISVMDSTSYLVTEKWSEPAGDERYYTAAVQRDRRPVYISVSGKPELIALEAESPECSPPAEGLVAHYPGDGVFEDIVSGATLTMPGNVRFAPGRVGQAFFFGDEPGYLTVTWTGHYNFGHGNSTLALYAKFTDLPGTRTIFSKTSSDHSIDVDLSKALDNRLVLQFATQGLRAKLEGTSAIAANTWYHLGVTKNDQELRLYIDGNLEGAVRFGTRGEVTDTDDSHPYFGAAQNRHNLLKGKLDEILFYNRVLTPDEIRRLYLMRELGNCRI